MEMTSQQITRASMKQDKIFQSFIKYIREHQMIQQNDQVLVAVSGGLDSTVLAFLMAKAQRVLGVKVFLSHVDHGVRREMSRREASWIKVLASRLNLPIHCLSVENKSNQKMSQETLRDKRRGLLTDLAEKIETQKIITAHHADDNAETFLMRSMSGTGPSGLRGMVPVEGVWLKPLLWMSREDLKEYARQNSLAWVEDPSNETGKYFRNRVRNELFPLLEDIRPSSKKNVSVLAKRLSEEEYELEAWLSKHFPKNKFVVSKAWLDNWPVSLKRRIYKLWLVKLGISPSVSLVETLLADRELIHPKGSFLIQEENWVFTPEKEFAHRWESSLPLELGKRCFIGQSMAWSFLSQAPKKYQLYDYSLYLCFRQPSLVRDKRSCIDWELMPDQLTLRSMNSSDSMELKELLNKAKIPLPYQRNWPLLVNAVDQKEVVAVVGFEVLKKYRYTGVGRCVALESFYEDALPGQVHP
jgi:tRNA(Ile)-lysidine synthetase-like protein